MKFSLTDFLRPDVPGRSLSESRAEREKCRN